MRSRRDIPSVRTRRIWIDMMWRGPEYKLQRHVRYIGSQARRLSVVAAKKKKKEHDERHVCCCPHEEEETIYTLSKSSRALARVDWPYHRRCWPLTLQIPPSQLVVVPWLQRLFISLILSVSSMLVAHWYVSVAFVCHWWCWLDDGTDVLWLPAAVTDHAPRANLFSICDLCWRMYCVCAPMPQLQPRKRCFHLLCLNLAQYHRWFRPCLQWKALLSLQPANQRSRQHKETFISSLYVSNKEAIAGSHRVSNKKP